MRTTLLACLSASTLVIAACGASDDAANDDNASVSTEADAETDGDDANDSGGDGSSDIGEQQQRVVELLLEGADEARIELDEDCVTDNVGQLTDDDAQTLADAGLEGQADISDEGDAIGEAVFSECVDAASYAKVQVEAIGEIDETVDEQCLSEALDGLTVDEIDEQIIDAATECGAET